MTTFHIRKSFKESWNLLFSKALFQKIAFVFIAITIPVLLLASFMERAIFASLQGGSAIIPIILLLVSFVVLLYTSAVSINASVSVVSTKKISLSKILKSSLNIKVMANLLGFFLTTLTLLIGVLLLFGLAGRVLPIVGVIGFVFALFVGFYIILRLFFGSYLIVDKKENFFRAIKNSFKQTQKIQGRLAGMLIIVGLIAFASGLFLELLHVVSPVIQAVFSYLIFTITLSPFISFVLATPYVKTRNK